MHWFTYDADTLIRKAIKSGIPFVMTNHFDNGLLSEPPMRRWLPHAKGVGSVSERGVPEHIRDRCVGLLDGIDTDFFSVGEAQCDERPRRPMILLPALVKKTKGPQDLLRVARTLLSRGLDFEICFAGAIESRPLWEELCAYAVAEGLESRVTFLGDISQAEMRRYYALSSIVVLPTYWEGLGRCLLEAQAMERPVVAYDSGGVADAVLPNQTGFLVKTGDESALADRIELLIRDEGERIRLGKRGREFVLGKFGVLSLVERHESFYLDALFPRPSQNDGN
jgi:glycosyltransferase involved in cell wall biosynthesis